MDEYYKFVKDAQVIGLAMNGNPVFEDATRYSITKSEFDSIIEELKNNTTNQQILVED